MKTMAAEKVLMSGQYSSLSEMAADINEEGGGGGAVAGLVPSKEIEDTIFKNMLKIMLEELNP